LQFYIIYLKTLKEQFHVYSCIFQRYPCIGLTVEDKVAEINYFFFFFWSNLPKTDDMFLKPLYVHSTKNLWVFFVVVFFLL